MRGPKRVRRVRAERVRRGRSALRELELEIGSGGLCRLGPWVRAWVKGHFLEGTHRLDEPVSNTTRNGCAGEPRLTSP